jgi:ATP/maltotriose-dependent transcriptional regulator MalT
VSCSRNEGSAPSRSALPRELEVLGLVVAGKTNRSIAQDLHVSLTTVKRHLERLTSRLRISDRTRAAVKATEMGLLPTPEDH